MKGPYAQIGQNRFSIIEVRLRDRAVQVCIRMRGPVAPFGPSPITIFDENEAGCWQGSPVFLSLPIGRGHVWDLWYSMHMTTVHEQAPHDLASM